MAILKRNKPSQVKTGRIASMSDEMLYMFAETQLMDAGQHLSQWRHNRSMPDVDMAAANARWAAEALDELRSRG